VTVEPPTGRDEPGDSGLPPGEEIWQTHIYNPDSEFHHYGGVVISEPEADISASENPPDERRVILTEGGPIEPVKSDRLYSWQASDDERIYRTVITDPATTVGYHLYGIETHGVGEEPALQMLLDVIHGDDEYHEPGNLESDFTDWMDLLLADERTRRLRLIDLLDNRIEQNDWVAEKYYDEGATWRSTNLSESGETLAANLIRRLGDKDLPHPRFCYATAGEAARLALRNHRVEYVEGVALPKQSGQAIRHAWIEIDGEVCELTWPWHAVDGDRANYFGVSIPKETVVKTRDRRARNGPVIPDDEEAVEFSNAMAGGNPIHDN
jgi:hypothetical protein